MQRDRLLIADMVAVASRIASVVGNHSLEAFTVDQMLRESVLWNFTVLGEAASQLSPELRDRYPDVGWRDPVNLRNRIVHGYASVDFEIVYAAATVGVPKLVEALKSVMAAEFPDLDDG